MCHASTSLSEIALRTVFRHTYFPINRESLLNVFSIVCRLYRHNNLHILGMKPDATRFSSVINRNNTMIIIGLFSALYLFVSDASISGHMLGEEKLVL